ncbi:protein sidekick [Centruroides vittatus]|uniref:protein sidekick n=2 Tax=Centruroides TaxID=6875 RepID=UPI00350F0455
MRIFCVFKMNYDWTLRRRHKLSFTLKSFYDEVLLYKTLLMCSLYDFLCFVSKIVMSCFRFFIHIVEFCPLFYVQLILILSPLLIQAEQQSAPHFVVQPSFTGGIVTENQSKILQCQAIGFPPPEYKWLKNGQSLGNFSHDPLLRISKITKTDEGIYQCIAHNNVGAIFSEKTALTVAYINDPKNVENKTITIEQGHAALLIPPEVESIPPPTVTWQRIGKGRLHGSKYVITGENHLVILSVEPEDSGQYQALLTNTQVGQEKSGPIITLIITANETNNPIAPKIIISPKDSIFTQGTYPASLECIANARPLEEINTIWKKDGRDIHLTGLSYILSPWNRSLTLTNIGTPHEGVYECQIYHRLIEEPLRSSAKVSVYIPPIITLPPQVETVSEITQRVSLPCESQGNPLPQISWYRNAALIKSLPENRYHISENGYLEIDNLVTEDSGIFQCVAKNEAGDVSASTWLHVKTSPPVFTRSPENVTILDGKDAEIKCEVIGAPLPNTTWIFNDTTIMHSSGRIQILENGNLLIASIESKDVGKYTCIRINSGGSISGHAYLNVLVRTQITQPPVDTKVILSSNAEMQCKVSHDSNVPYTIAWYFGTKKLESRIGGRVQILNDNTLQIRQARNTDVGLYTCEVISPGGNETRSAKLNVIELPHPPANVKVDLLNTLPKTVNISWSNGFDGNSPITNYIVQKRTVPSSDGYVESLIPWVTAKTNISGTQRYAILSNLKPASSYQFRMSAVNGVGEGNPSKETEVITLPPEPPSGPPQGVVGGARSSTSVMLQWQPPSEEDRNGDLKGYTIRYKLAGYSASPWVYNNVSNEAQHSLMLQDLIVWQNYEIQVAAYNEKGIGVFSDSIYIRTRQGIPQAAPTEVRADALNSTAVKVRWKPPDPQLVNGINLGYKVQCWFNDLHNNSHPSRTELVAPSPTDPWAEQQIILSNLEKFTTYSITVLCFTSPGDGPRSDPVSVTTAQDVPDVVSNIKFENILDTSAKVLWSPPVNINGILKGYTLKYHVKDMPETTVVKNLTAEITSVVVDNLRPVTAYTFIIFAWTIIGPGPSRTAVIQSGIPPVLPSPPSKLAVSNIGAFSVVLQFTPGFDGNSSIIKWNVEAQLRRNETWFKIYEVSDPDATTLTVYNLIPFTEYCLRLYATNVVGNSEPSEPSKFFQTIQAPPSHPPYNVTLRAVNANAIRVRWTPLQQVEWYGIPRGYNISYRIYPDTSENYESIILEDHNANSYVLKNLEEFTTYEVFVQAYNDVGYSMPSPKAQESTRESVPSMGPLNVTANATSSTTIVVKWNEVPKIDQNGIIEGYKVYFGAKMVPFKYKVIENNITYTTTLTELRKYTLYSIQVLAFTRIGDGALSLPPVHVQTLEDVPGIPSNISFPDVSTTTARILWDVPEEPNGIITAYRVSYHINSTLEGSITKELPSTDRTLKVFNLNPETYYLFTVTAKTSEGWGKTAQAIVFTTNNREAPQPPSALYIRKSQIQARQIAFSWTPGRDGFAPLRYYIIEISDHGIWKTLPIKVDPSVTTYTVTGLKPFTLYKFRLQAINDIGASGWSPESEVTQTLPAAPDDPPSHVLVSPYTTTSVRVNWEPLPEFKWYGDTQTAGYRIEYCQLLTYTVSRSSDCPSNRVYGVNISTVLLPNLEQDNIYEIRVYAFNNQGDSIPSLPVSVFVGEAVPTGEPQDISMEALSSTEIKVSWKPPLETKQNGDLLGYKIFYKPLNEEGSEEMEAVPATTKSFVLMDLKKYCVYNIQILGFNPAGDGPRSVPQKIRTKEDVPGPPGKLVFSNITMTSLNVSWNEPVEANGKIKGYLLVYETAVEDIDYSRQVRQRVTVNHLAVYGLGEKITYTFRVRAETFDYGPESISNVTTGPQKGSPESPQDLILLHTPTSFTLKWKNGASESGPILGYIIEIRPLDELEWNTLTHLNNGPQISYTVSFQNLLPSTNYHLRLFARNEYGVSMPVVATQPVATPSKFYLEYRQKLPFYREVWFMVMLAATSVVIIIIVIAVLCVKSKAYKYRKDIHKSLQDDHLSMDDGGFATFELRQSKRGTLCKNSLSRKSTSTVITKSPPRPSPASITYSDDEDVKGYDENCDSSSLTEKPSEISSTDSQGTDSEGESDTKSEPHSFVNHYANVNDTLRQSWKRQKPVKPPSYTDSEPEGSIAVSLNGGHIIMNNMAGSRAPLPGFSSFV